MLDVGPSPRGAAPERPREDSDGGVLIVRGPTVSLRTLAPRDMEMLGAWADSPFIERMVGSDLLHAYKHVYDKSPSFYDACLNDPTQVVFVILANGAEERALGMVRLFNIHLLEGYAFLETLIADQKALRRGYGIEAAKLVLCYGLDVLGLRRVEAKVYAYNVLSMNSLRRNGFQQEGVLRQAGYQDGQPCDVVVFGILREELEERRRKENFYFPFEGVEGGVDAVP